MSLLVALFLFFSKLIPSSLGVDTGFKCCLLNLSNIVLMYLVCFRLIDLFLQSLVISIPRNRDILPKLLNSSNFNGFCLSSSII
jgi:hypothetical protein